MQAVQQCPKLGECGGRGQRTSNGKVRALRRIGDPRRESADGAVGQLAKDVLTFWELRPPLNAKTPVEFSLLVVTRFVLRISPPNFNVCLPRVYERLSTN